MKIKTNIMTTFDEISNNADLNYKFWSDDAKLHAISYFMLKNKGSRLAKFAKMGFLSSMGNRRSQFYLDETIRNSPLPIIY